MKAFFSVIMGCFCCIGVALPQGVLAQQAVPDPQHDQREQSEEQSVPPDDALTPEILYGLMLAEIAAARGELKVAMDVYIQLAQQTQDPRIAKRATEIALYGRNFAGAIQTARLWVAADPTSEEARDVFARVMAGSGHRLDDVQFQLAKILADSPEHLKDNLLGLNRALAGLPDKQVARDIVERLTVPYLGIPEAYFARAQAALIAEDPLDALHEIDQGLQIRPLWDVGVLLRVQALMQMNAMIDAQRFLESFLEMEPDNTVIREAYGQILAVQNQLPQARRQFQILLDKSPDDVALMNTVAILSAQMKDYDTASSLFEKMLGSNAIEADGIRFNLGQIAEQQKNYDAALAYYRQITADGRSYWDTQLRIALVLSLQGKTDEALQQLQQVDGGENEPQLLMARIMILRDADRLEEAQKILDEALRLDPDSPELLYESGMLAERMDRLDVMEMRFRKLIALDPEYAHAYNALGYSLADRGVRLDEAAELVGRALELLPEDPYIIDSMGWVYFRKNENELALDYLRRAYDIKQDAEIAAHLGEVFWTMDRRDDAQDVWNKALKAYPDNALLRQTIERLTGQPPE